MLQWNTVTLCIILVVCHVTSVQTSGSFTVTLDHYNARQDSCGWSESGDCDVYFNVCLRQPTTGSNYCKKTSRNDDTHDFVFSGSSVNPIQFKLHLDSLEDELELNVAVKDYDTWPSGDDDMDTLVTRFYGRAGPANTLTMTGRNDQYRIKLDVKILIECDVNYYGNRCSIFCKNETSFFCTSDGVRTCTQGYDGPNCTRVTSTTPIMPTSETLLSTPRKALHSTTELTLVSDSRIISKHTTEPSTPLTTQPPTTQPPTTQPPTTQPPTTQSPTTQPPTTQSPTTQPPTTQPPITQPPTTQPPITQSPTTQSPTTQPPTTQPPTTQPPTTQSPTTTPQSPPTALLPRTAHPTTKAQPAAISKLAAAAIATANAAAAAAEAATCAAKAVAAATTAAATAAVAAAEAAAAVAELAAIQCQQQ